MIAPPAAEARGSATLVVFILLTIMVALIAANTRTLHHLKGELRLIEQRQLKKFNTSTNETPVLHSSPGKVAP
jgi:hypothetical protein